MPIRIETADCWHSRHLDSCSHGDAKLGWHAHPGVRNLALILTQEASFKLRLGSGEQALRACAGLHYAIESARRWLGRSWLCESVIRELGKAVNGPTRVDCLAGHCSIWRWGASCVVGIEEAAHGFRC